MPRYRYRAVNRWGDPFRGEREAADREALAASLAAEGLELRDAEPLPEGHEPPPPPAPPPSGTAPQTAPTVGSRAAAARLDAADARELAEQLAGLSAAGLPMPSGLRAAAEEVADGPLRAALLDLADSLERGQPIGEAIEQTGDRLPGHLRGLLLAAAHSERIGDVLGEFVNYTQVGAALRRSLWLTLTYPLLLVGCLGLVFVFATTVVVPGFKSIYQDFGVALPVATMFLVAVSDAVLERGPEIAALAIVGAVVLWVAARVLLDPASRRRLVCRVPLFGPLWRWTALAEFAHFLGLLVDCELPLGRALPLAARGARDPELERACEHIAAEVADGRPLSEALSWWQAIPQGLVKLLRWSEGQQTLGEALHMAGALFETRARSQATYIGAVTVVVTIILVLWGAGLLVVALFLPLIRLLSVLA